MKKYLCIFFGLLFFQAHAQSGFTYQLNVQTIAPAPQRFYDFFNIPGKVIVTSTRIALPGDTASRNFWLTGKCTGDNGVVIYTSESYQPKSFFYSDATSPVKVITGFDLRDCFEFNNVVVESPNGFFAKNDLQSKLLPPGKYTICLTANSILFGQNTVVSEEYCSMDFVVSPSTEPPILLSPLCDNDVTQLIPQQIIFTWTPVFSIPNVEYTFKLIQLNSNQDPQLTLDAVSASVFFETKTTVSTLVYGLDAPPLTVGKKYAWRVTAKTAEGDLIKNNGKSGVCTFTYLANDVPPPAAQTAIHLLLPADQTVLKMEANGAVFRWDGNPNNGYYLNFAEMQNGQIPEVAMTNAVKQKKVISETGKEISDGGLIYHFGNSYYQLTPGKKYAWCVVDDHGNRSVETWELSIPILLEDTIKVKKFDMNGFIVYVDSVDSPNPNYFFGKGYLYLWNDPSAPKVNVSFSGLNLVNQSYTTNGGPSNWKCARGKLEGEIINGLQHKLYSSFDADFGGDYLLIGKSVNLNAEEKAQLNADGKSYSVTTNGTETRSQVKAFLKWQTSLLYKFISIGNSDDPQSGINKYINVISEEGYINITPNKELSGSLTCSKSADYDLIYPLNYHLRLSSVNFDVKGKYAYSFINGSVKVPDGRQDIDRDLTIDFYNQKSFNFGIKIPDYTIPLNLTSTTSGSNASPITMEARFDSLEVYLAVGKGISIPNFYVTANLPNQSVEFIFHDAMNLGGGYMCKASAPQQKEITLNTFKAKVTFASLDIHNSIAQKLVMNGEMAVPFLNLSGKFNYYIDAYGLFNGIVNFDKESTVYDHVATGDKLKVKVNSAFLVKDRILVDADFSFTNSAEKNLNLPPINLSKLFILSDGAVGWNQNFPGDFGAKYFTDQGISGTFNGYAYKPFKLLIGFSNNQYKFTFSGPLVLEETLTSTTSVKIEIAYTLPDPNTTTSSPFLASANSSLEMSSANVSSPSPGSVNTVVSTVYATAQSNGLVDFGDVGFNYFENDPDFGTGFIASSKVNVKNPFEGAINSKIVVGRTNNYSYWFISGGQEGAQESATGVLDIVISGYNGRIYHHMKHKENGGILNDDYIPSNSVGYGAYGDLILKTKASNGSVFWAKGGVEIQTASNGSVLPILIQGDAYLLSSGVNSTNAIINGHAVVTINPGANKYVHGSLDVSGDVLSYLSVQGSVDIFMSPTQMQYFLGTAAAPVGMTIKGVNTTVNGYYGVEYNSGTYKEFAQLSGYLFYINPTWSGNIGYSPFDCDWTIKSNAYLHGAIYGEATIPFNGGSLPNITGSVALNAYASIYGSLCGVGGGTGIGGTLKGAFSMPSPFCIAGEATLVTPDPLPNLSLPFRFKDGGYTFKNTCD
ncbi:MAG: hypothetical protein ACKVQV_07355 [Bacteroidia bacterium]